MSTIYKNLDNNSQYSTSLYTYLKSNSTSLLLLIFVFIMGFVSAQRFLLPELSALTCIILLVLPLITGIHDKQYLTIFFLSIVSIADLGGLVYSETPSAVKYLIYASILGFMALNLQFGYNKKHRYLILFSLFVVLNTFLHPNSLDSYTLGRDILTLFLLLFISFSFKLKSIYLIEANYILYFSIGILVSELFNIFSSYTVLSGDYLNYSSFKFLALFPVIYFLSYRKYYTSAIIAPISFLVIGVYASRMLLITGILVCLILAFNGFRKSFWRTLLLFLISIVISLIFLKFLDVDLQAYRVLSIFFTMNSFNDLTSAALFLDPVRFAENTVFFEQNLFNLLLGNGLGTGIIDETGIFSFVPNDGAAFSPKELNESHFFRLHDSWTWFGFRFGLLAYLLFVFWAVKGCFSKNPETALFAAFMLLALFNATFSIGGLIACAVLALHYKLLSAYK